MLPRPAYLLAFVLFLTGATALAEIRVIDAYARSSGPAAPTGAAFMVIENRSESADRLIGVQADVAEKVELHTHIADDDGIMRMRPLDDGIPIEAGSSHALARGGDHVMLMGLTDGLTDGGVVPITLFFEKAGAVVVDVPVDLSR